MVFYSARESETYMNRFLNRVFHLMESEPVVEPMNVVEPMDVIVSDGPVYSFTNELPVDLLVHTIVPSSRLIPPSC